MFESCKNLISIIIKEKNNEINPKLNNNNNNNSQNTIILDNNLCTYNPLSTLSIRDKFNNETNELYKESESSISSITKTNNFNNLSDENNLLTQHDSSPSSQNIIITDMGYMFYGCNSLKSFEIPKWDMSNVKNMSYIFYECNSLIALPDISNSNTSNIRNMSHMFFRCNPLILLPKKLSVRRRVFGKPICILDYNISKNFKFY
jgi:surface protein